MLKYMDEGKQTLEREIDKILKTGDISVSTLEKLHKLTDTYKNLCKIYIFYLLPGFTMVAFWSFLWLEQQPFLQGNAFQQYKSYAFLHHFQLSASCHIQNQ